MRILNEFEFLRKYPWSVRAQMIACGYYYGNLNEKLIVNFAKGCVRRKFGLGHHAFKKIIKADIKQKAYTLV
jgi:hypothetical protein